MATDAEIQAKRDSIAAKRAEIQSLRQNQAAADAAAGRDAKLAALSVEEQSLEAELAALRAAAPAPASASAAATPKTTSTDAAENKE